MKQEEKTKCTRERILAAAMEEFGTNGYAGASLNSVCSTGISKGLLYHNFENRDDLYLACVARCFSMLTQALQAADIGNDFQKYMCVRMRFFQENARQAHLFFEAILQPPEGLRAEIAVRRRELDAINLALYEKILDDIPLRSDITREEALSYFSLMQNMFNGYFSSAECSSQSLADRMKAHEARLTKLLDFMLYGIAKRGNES